MPFEKDLKFTMTLDNCKDWLDVLRLMLLGRLIYLTGVIWDVTVDINGWHFIFHCRWSIRRFDACATQDYSLDEIESLLLTRMEESATSIVQRFWKRQREQNETKTD